MLSSQKTRAARMHDPVGPFAGRHGTTAIDRLPICCALLHPDFLVFGTIAVIRIEAVFGTAVIGDIARRHQVALILVAAWLSTGNRAVQFIEQLPALHME